MLLPEKKYYEVEIIWKKTEKRNRMVKKRNVKKNG